MKIEVTVSWYDRFQTEENKIRFDTITIRVPKDVKVLCKETIIKLLRERENRIHDINQHIWKKNQRTKELFGFERFKVIKTIEFWRYQYVSWSPIIETEKLEFIIKEL